MKTMKAEKKSMGKKWFSHVLKTAKKTYHKKGGEEKEEMPATSAPAAMPTEGAGKKRRGGKTRRHRK